MIDGCGSASAAASGRSSRRVAVPSVTPLRRTDRPGLNVPVQTRPDASIPAVVSWRNGSTSALRMPLRSSRGCPLQIISSLLEIPECHFTPQIKPYFSVCYSKKQLDGSLSIWMIFLRASLNDRWLWFSLCCCFRAVLAPRCGSLGYAIAPNGSARIERPCSNPA